MSSTDAIQGTGQVAKRRSYIIAVGLVFTAMVLLWATTGTQSGAVALATYPARAVFLAAILAGLVSGILSVAATERIIIAVMSVFFLGRMALILFGPDQLLASDIDVAEPLLLGALMYPLLFLAFDTSKALRLGLGIYGVFVGLVVLGVLPEVLRGPVGERTAIILTATGIHGGMIALLWVLSSRKELLASEQARTAVLEAQANTDLLTGAANRRRVEFELDRRITESARYGSPVSVILIDLDRFKTVNDQYGHDTGDRVLRETVRQLEGALRSSDMLGRWGGEEFVIVAPGIDANHAARLAERCRRLIAATSHPLVGQVLASFGVASHQADDTLRSLLRRADEALYESKTRGRDRVSVAA